MTTIIYDYRELSKIRLYTDCRSTLGNGNQYRDTRRKVVDVSALELQDETIGKVLALAFAGGVESGRRLMASVIDTSPTEISNWLRQTSKMVDVTHKASLLAIGTKGHLRIGGPARPSHIYKLVTLGSGATRGRPFIEMFQAGVLTAEQTMAVIATVDRGTSPNIHVTEIDRDTGTVKTKYRPVKHTDLYNAFVSTALSKIRTHALAGLEISPTHTECDTNDLIHTRKRS